jgi:hypothetical protein
MLKFFFKKNFCDGWDNIFSLLIPNVISVILGIGVYLAVGAVAAINVPLSLLVLAAGCGIVMIPVYAWGWNAKKIADFDSPSLGSYFKLIPHSIINGFLFGVIIGAFIVIGSVSIPYYLAMFKHGNLIGLLFVALIFWFLLIAALALQWFIPLTYLQDYNTFSKCLKKSFIIFFDNPAFSFVMGLYNILLLVMSVFLFFIVPGTAGITLSQMNALRLRLYKYDWLEENPDIAADKDKRCEVPWDTLTAQDKETLGPRNLQSFIFPWK